MPEGSFLGTGMKFPPQVNRATGRFEVASEKESVKESVYLILMTQQTERFTRPNFGSNLMSYTFMDVNNTTLSIMIRDLTEQLTRQEPRIQDVRVAADDQVRDGCLIVNIGYTIRNTNVRDNLVFPFYLNVTDEEEEAYEPEQYESEEME